MLHIADFEAIWSYLNPQEDLDNPEYFLAKEDFPNASNYWYRELDLLLDRSGCLDASLP